jgi:NAD(P)-dependent dehydrogenase (short-subunit alcohol dehydrogenase family)
MEPGHSPLVALVTGANRGIGLEVVRQLAEQGYHVYLAARDPENGEVAAQSLAPEVARRVSVTVLDVTDPRAAARAAGEVASRHGGLHALVNNAAIHYDTWQRAANADLAIVTEALETNLLGAWRTTQAFLPLLTASGHGRVVNVSSGAGAITEMGAGPPAYQVSKAALNALTRTLAAELSASGILVNAVCPGWVATDMGGHGGRPVADGAAGVVWAVTLPDNGPTGGFFRDGRPIAW